MIRQHFENKLVAACACVARRWRFVAALLFVLSLPSEAQLRIYVDSVDASNFPEVRVFFSVSYAGQRVTNLSPADFTLLEDGVVRIPSFVSCDTLSQASDVSVMLIIDRSGSMIGEPLEDAKDAATVFVNLLRPADEASLIAFDTRVQQLIPFTTDKTAVAAAINTIMLGDYTNLWLACMNGVAATATRSNRKAIVLLSDGFNTIPSGFDVDAVINASRQSGIPFFVIGLGTEVDSTALRKLATETNGRYFYSPTSKDLEEIYREIARIINNTGRCMLTFRSGLRCLDGLIHFIDLHVTWGGQTASGRGSFKAPYQVSTMFTVGAALNADAVIEAGEKKKIPIVLSQTASEPVNVIEFDLAYDSTLLKLVEVTTAPQTAAFTMTVARTSTGIHVTLTGTAPIVSGEIAFVEFLAREMMESAQAVLRFTNTSVHNRCANSSDRTSLIAISGKCERVARPVVRSSSPRIELHQNVPNPANPSTRIEFTLPSKQRVTLELFSPDGRRVETIAAGEFSEGKHVVTYDASACASGIYFYRLRADGHIAVRRMLILR